MGNSRNNDVTAGTNLELQKRLIHKQQPCCSANSVDSEFRSVWVETENSKPKY